MKKEWLAYYYGSLCILFWALIPTISKYLLRELDNLQILFYSTVFSVVTLFVIILFQRKILLFRNYSMKDYLWMFFLGFLGSYLYYVLLYGAFNLTTAAEGYILAYTWPIIAVLLGVVVLNEKFTFLKIFAVFVSFMGAVVVFTKGNFIGFSLTNVSGNILAILAAVTFAFFSIFGKKSKFDRTISAFVYWLAALVCISLTIPFFSSFKLFSFTAFFLLLINGVIINGITYIFWFKALELGDTAKISNLLYLSPFLALIYIFLFLKEEILFSSIVGLVIIMIGIIIQSVRKE